MKNFKLKKRSLSQFLFFFSFFFFLGLHTHFSRLLLLSLSLCLSVSLSLSILLFLFFSFFFFLNIQERAHDQVIRLFKKAVSNSEFMTSRGLTSVKSKSPYLLPLCLTCFFFFSTNTSGFFLQSISLLLLNPQNKPNRTRNRKKRKGKKLKEKTRNEMK